MDLSSLGLEPTWDNLTEGSRIDCLSELVVWDSQQLKHLVKSSLHGRFLVVEGSLPKAAAYTLLNVKVLRGGQCNQAPG